MEALDFEELTKSNRDVVWLACACRRVDGFSVKTWARNNLVIALFFGISKFNVSSLQEVSNRVNGAGKSTIVLNWYLDSPYTDLSLNFEFT